MTSSHRPSSNGSKHHAPRSASTGYTTAVTYYLQPLGLVPPAPVLWRRRPRACRRRLGGARPAARAVRVRRPSRYLPQLHDFRNTGHHAIAATQAHLAQGRRRGRRARHDGDSGTGRRRRVEGRGVCGSGTHRRGRRRHLLDEVFSVQPALPVSSETGDPGSASTAESGGHAAFGHCRFRCGRDKGTGRSEAGPHLDASSAATGRRLRAGHGGARRVPGDAATETKDEAEGRDQRAGRASRRAALVRFAGWGVGVI